MATTNEKVTRLRDLMGSAGALHYERIKLAKEIIEDNHWVLQNFGGDELRAGAVLEKEYFGDLCGAINFWRLIKIIENFPEVEDWESRKFNLTAMSAEIDSRKEGKKKSANRWSVTQREYEELESERDRLKKLFENKKVEAGDYEKKVRDLESAVESLSREKARLEHRVAELEALLEAMRGKKKIA